jgi:ADP-ribose pyrophosphatase YjhB (NUDIX family)
MASREYPAHPIPGVGVVALKDSSVLLIRRGREPRRGEWSIPGGGVEVGERVADAAIREFREECGGEVELRALVDVVDIFARDDDDRVRFHYIVTDYWGEWKSGELRAGSDVMDARWVPLADIDAYSLPPWTRAVIEKAAALRASAR